MGNLTPAGIRAAAIPILRPRGDLLASKRELFASLLELDPDTMTGADGALFRALSDDNELRALLFPPEAGDQGIETRPDLDVPAKMSPDFVDEVWRANTK